MSTRIHDVIDNMKSIADHLVEYTFPNVSIQTEKDVLCLKERTIFIDGYEIIVQCSKSDRENYMLETIQIQSPQVPFLPFLIVCKLGKLFLGQNNLAYVDFFKYNRKIYCWSVKTIDGKSIPVGDKCSPTSFDGFDFYLLNPESVDLL